MFPTFELSSGFFVKHRLEGSRRREAVVDRKTKLLTFDQRETQECDADSESAAKSVSCCEGTWPVEVGRRASISYYPSLADPRASLYRSWGKLISSRSPSGQFTKFGFSSQAMG